MSYTDASHWSRLRVIKMHLLFPVQPEESVALQGARDSDRSGEPGKGQARPGMDYRRSEISKRDLECQQGAEGTGLSAPGKASTLSSAGRK